MPFAMVKDGKPLVGHVKEGVWLVAGLGCCGITIAPMAAKLLVDAMCGVKSAPSCERIMKELCPRRAMRVNTAQHIG